MNRPKASCIAGFNGEADIYRRRRCGGGLLFEEAGINLTLIPYLSMSYTTTSINGISIRLTKERWGHIVEEHAELDGMMDTVLLTVNSPEIVLAGNSGEFLAVRKFEPKKYLVVPYREFNNDGFIITAFLTRRIHSLQRRKQIWPR